MEDREEDLDIHRKKLLNGRATSALLGCLQWRGRCMGACFFFNWKATSSGSSGHQEWSCWWTRWKKKTNPQKFFFFFFVFLRFEVFFCWKWALDSSGWLKKKLGHWDSSVSSRFHGFQNGQSVESFGPLGAGADPKICRQPSLSKLGLDLGGPNSHPLGDIHKIGKSLWPFGMVLSDPNWKANRRIATSNVWGCLKVTLNHWLGGGNSIIFNSHPKNWGNDFQFDEKNWLKPPTWSGCWMSFSCVFKKIDFNPGTWFGRYPIWAYFWNGSVQPSPSDLVFPLSYSKQPLKNVGGFVNGLLKTAQELWTCQDAVVGLFTQDLWDASCTVQNDGQGKFFFQFRSIPNFGADSFWSWFWRRGPIFGDNLFWEANLQKSFLGNHPWKIDTQFTWFPRKKPSPNFSISGGGKFIRKKKPSETIRTQNFGFKEPFRIPFGWRNWHAWHGHPQI